MDIIPLIFKYFVAVERSDFKNNLKSRNNFQYLRFNRDFYKDMLNIILIRR